MKILIARMNHETNTFSPVATPLSAFGGAGPCYDQAAYQDNKGMRTAMSAFIEAAEGLDAHLVTPLSAQANPSGPVAADAYELMCQKIVDAAVGCDAVMLDLHGAMVAEQTPDGEGDLLERVRAALPNAPIAVALDLHANVTQKMIDNADVIVSFKTYPHVDMYECGAHAGRLLVDLIQGRSKPVTTWCQVPLLTHTLRSSAAVGAMKTAVDAALAAEAMPGTLAVSILAGFSLADIPAPRISVVVVGEGGREGGLQAANEVAQRIAARIWADRDEFVYRSAPLADSVAEAAAMAQAEAQTAIEGLAAPMRRPVLLLDHGDNCMSGGTCDTMDLFEETLRQKLTGIVSGPICDPEAVALLAEAGVGATVTLDIGNKLRGGGARPGHPISLTGIVRAVTNGEYIISGPTYTGQRAYMGRAAVLDIGPALILVTERTHEPWDLGVFESVGIDPRQATFLLLKSRMYCRPVFVPLAAGLVECDSRGVTSSDYSLFAYKHLQRPVYPFDTDMHWEAE